MNLYVNNKNEGLYYLMSSYQQNPLNKRPEDRSNRKTHSTGNVM